MMDKEKDLAHLKFNLQEMKTHFHEEETEVLSLKAINKELQMEMKIVKELNLELKEEFEKEINVRRDNEKLMETKISSLEQEVRETKNILIDTNKETLSLKSQLENFNIDANEKLILCHKDIETVKNDISNTANSPLIDDMVKLKDSVNIIQTDIRSTRNHLDESLNKKTDEMTKLTCHVANIENVLFCCDPYKDNYKLKWVIQNYENYFFIGKPVYSPLFYTQVSGYCFKLCVQRPGNKGNVEFYWKLCRGKNNYIQLKPFSVPFRIQIQGRNMFYPILPHDIDNRDAYFTIHPDEDEARRLFFVGDLTLNHFNDIVVGTLSITCIFNRNIRY